MATKAGGDAGGPNPPPAEVDKNTSAPYWWTGQREDLVYGETSRDTIVDAAEAHLVPIAEQTAQRWAGGIQNGHTTFEAFLAYVRAQAADLYPQFAQQIAAGVEPRALFEPWQRIAEAEMGDGVTLTRPDVLEALMASKTSQEFRGFLRELPQWESGPGARGLLRRFMERVGGRLEDLASGYGDEATRSLTPVVGDLFNQTTPQRGAENEGWNYDDAQGTGPV